MQRYNAITFLSRFMSTEDDSVELLRVLEKLPALSKAGPWIAGGAVRRTMLIGNLDSDFDFFFKDDAQLSAFRKEIADKGAKKTSENNHAETYTISLDNKNRFIQLIKIGFYESPEAVIDSFDFTITQCAYDGSELIFGEYTLWDLARKRLALHKLTYGVATMRRLLKYTQQGFIACSGTMQSILEAVVKNPAIIQSDVEYVD